ncbi:hypothetical protein M440DRAFT_1466964 [Trichoderma longibrachiatum ATCC 18648]|uniref:Uncharacterized protein n=1 Tax=Trichoderma longibrachiatum ATCC 18648 TaxID=983965 RepID=A0A2T4CIR0_TRILO|nr:hypothetical protein M440DRAFT_1466964 [Trichoderma longibrachiatum ATCC 18648]
MPHQTRHPSSPFNPLSSSSSSGGAYTTSNRITRHRRTQPPSNVPNPPYQHPPPFTYGRRTPSRSPQPRPRSSLTLQIKRGISCLWKSFKKRFHTRSERYEYALVLPSTHNHQEQLPSTPIPSTLGLYPWRRPNLPPLQPANLPLSYFCRVTPYQSGQIAPTVQSPYYFLVHLPIPGDQPASSASLRQQEEQSPWTPNYLVSPYSLYRP